MLKALADGLTYHKTRFQDSDVHTLRVQAPSFVRAVPAFESFPMTQGYDRRPPELARDAGALASVGGVFPMTIWHSFGVTGQPMQAFGIDGELWTTGTPAGATFIQGKPGTRAWVERPKSFIRIWDGKRPIEVRHVNRGHEDTVIFTPRGGTNEYPKSWHNRFHTRLGHAVPDPKDSEVVEWAVEATGLYPWKVLPGTVVVESDENLGLVTGKKVRVTQHYSHPWRQYITGMTPLVLDGKNVVADIYAGEDPGGPDAPYLKRNPRTGLGVSPDGMTTIITAVQGRQDNNRGLTMKGLATLMLDLGAGAATNIDGGGSTHMWEKDAGLLMDSVYGDGTLQGIRPNICAVAVF